MKARQILQVDDEDRVRFVLRLAGTDVPALRERALRGLWRHARAFFGLPSSSGIKVIGSRSAQARYTSDENERRRKQLLKMQGDAAGVLEQVRTGRPVSVPMSDVTMIGHPGDPHSVAFRGSVAATFRAALAFLLFNEPGGHVRACPECTALFYRVRRQEYCSARCTDRAVWRNYSPERKRRARRKQYAKYGWKLGARTGRK